MFERINVHNGIEAGALQCSRRERTLSGEGEGGAYLGTDERIEEKNDDGEEVPSENKVTFLGLPPECITGVVYRDVELAKVPSENKVTFLGLPPDCITGVYGDVELAKELEEIKLETTRL